MNKYSILFSQLLSVFPRLDFERLVRHEIKDLKIDLSRYGDTAWFFCMLNDIST